MARKKAKALPQPEPEMFTVYGDILQETEDALYADGEDTTPVSDEVDDAESTDIPHDVIPEHAAESPVAEAV